MIASDLRFAHRADGWYLVDVTAGTTVSGPHGTFTDAIDARKELARVDTNAQMDTQRKRAAAWSRELEQVRQG